MTDIADLRRADFSVLRAVPLPKRLTGALEAESGLHDAPTVVLVALVVMVIFTTGVTSVSATVTPRCRR